MSIRLSRQQREQLTRTLKRAIEPAKGALATRGPRIASFIRRWEAKSRPKSFPFGTSHSASFHMPFTAIAYDAIKARVMNAVFGQDKDVNARAILDIGTGLPDEGGTRELTWADIAESFEKYVLWELGASGDWKLRDRTEDLFDEGGMTGTGIMGVDWRTRVESDLPPDATGLSQAEDRIVFDNVQFSVGATENHLFPAGYPDPRLMSIPWFSRLYILRKSQLLANVDGAGWSESAIREYLSERRTDRAHPTEVAQAQAAVEGETDEYNLDEIWMAETWMRFPMGGGTDANGERVPTREVKLLIDHPLNAPESLFRVIGWPYAHGRMKFARLFRYIKRRQRLLGMGIPERGENVDEALSTIINLVIDGAKSANAPIWLADATVQGVRDFRDLYPGAVIKHAGGDPNSLIPLKGASVGPDLFEAFNIVQQLGQQALKISEPDLGRELNPSAPATSTLALLQQSNQYFDSVTRDIRATLTDALYMATSLVAQNKPLDRVRQVLGDARAQAVLTAIALPPEDLERRIALDVAFQNSASTREIARQEEMAKFQILQSYFQALILLADQRVEFPFKAPMIDAIAMSADKVMRRLLETFGDSAVAETLPVWSEFVAVFEQERQQREQIAAVSGGAPAEAPVSEEAF